ncbi:hypothetical protein CAEBREN_00007 [Caenorhabditis brenneri]|uniref:Uncharacterized protein n=1 Tax=Caenorhabditis brenneri TaxID=135651 RepID=G0MDF4_CAEBE|nr:hypothetical protein CAEBREN_00007 [Caenorhabditis brenneri]
MKTFQTNRLTTKPYPQKPSASSSESKSLEKYLEKMSMIQKPGPLSVTLDVAGTGEDKFLAFSIHYFEDGVDRKNVVFLRKLLLSKLDTDSILNTIRSTINSKYNDVRFTDIVCPNDKIFSLFDASPVFEHTSKCFFHHMTNFVTNILDIDEFFVGLCELQEFVSNIKQDPKFYKIYKKIQSSRNEDSHLPNLDEGSWINTLEFLTRSLVLHDTFTEISNLHQPKFHYIKNETFNHLVYLQRFLHECFKSCIQMSSSASSISQIQPAILELKQFLDTISMGYYFEQLVSGILDRSFGELLNEKRYCIATLLDPCFAYRDSIYSGEKWEEIEDMLHKEVTDQEIIDYRKYSFLERPENPFSWWSTRQSMFPQLSLIAREYLACPAVSVDAAHFYSNYGKSEQGSPNQEFRGKAGMEDWITEERVEKLNKIANRVQKSTNFDPNTYTTKASVEEREMILNLQYPLPEDPDKTLEAEIKLEVVDPDELTPQPKPLNQYFVPAHVMPRVVMPKVQYSPTFSTRDPIPKNRKAGTLYKEVLNEVTARKAMERHQMNLELQRPVNRHCAVCHLLIPQELLKNVTIEYEKILIMTARIYRGEISIEQAKEFMAIEKPTNVCHKHFGETIDQIFKILPISCADDIEKLSEDSIAGLMAVIASIRSYFKNSSTVKVMTRNFIERNARYWTNREIPTRSNPPREPNDVTDDDIIPKAYRQPRKQILESDIPTVSTYRIHGDGLSQEDYDKLPRKRSKKNMELENSGKKGSLPLDQPAQKRGRSKKPEAITQDSKVVKSEERARKRYEHNRWEDRQSD